MDLCLFPLCQYFISFSSKEGYLMPVRDSRSMKFNLTSLPWIKPICLIPMGVYDTTAKFSVLHDCNDDIHENGFGNLCVGTPVFKTWRGSQEKKKD